MFLHLLFTSWRGKSYIAMQEKWVIENWANYVDWSFCCCCWCCCYCVILLLFFIFYYRWTTTTTLHSNNNKNEDQNINPDMRYWKLSNFCICIFLLFLFLLLLFLLLLCNFVVGTTTKFHMINKKKKINLHTFSVQLSITHLRSQITGRHTYVRCTPQ